MKQKRQSKAKEASKKKIVRKEKQQKVQKLKKKTETKKVKQIKEIKEIKTIEKQIVLDYWLKQQGNKIKVKLNAQYQIQQTNQLYKILKDYFKLFEEKQKSKNQKLYLISQFTYFPSFQFILAKQKPKQEKCSICQFQFQEPEDYEQQLVRKNDEDVVALKCTHKLHYSCLKMLIGEKDWLKCPVCSTIYGCMIGDQPAGTMNIQIHPELHCEGYLDCGTIVITYFMKSGSREGINFPSTTRTAYLPNNKGGKQVLQLLKKAFDRKLIFTIGRSVTTGRDNQIVWNGIHHKTNTSGGSAYFGYPDDTYFDRVKLQLAAKGVY